MISKLQSFFYRLSGVSAPLLLIGIIAIATFTFAFSKFQGDPAYAARQNTPHLPAGLSSRINPKLPTLVEFYAAWCSTCQKMEPTVNEIEKTAKGKLNVIRLDVDKKGDSDWADKFQVNGTPTYVMYNAAGNPTYRMDSRISSAVLEAEVYSMTGQASQYKLPQNISALNKAKSKYPMMLVAFGEKGCKPCETGDYFVRAAERESHGKIGVVRLQKGKEGVSSLMGQMKVKTIPTYLLLDNHGNQLMRVDNRRAFPALTSYSLLFASNRI